MHIIVIFIVVININNIIVYLSRDKTRLAGMDIKY